MHEALPAITLSATIRRDPRDVCDFICDPTKLPLWAEGLGETVQKRRKD